MFRSEQFSAELRSSLMEDWNRRESFESDLSTSSSSATDSDTSTDIEVSPIEDADKKLLLNTFNSIKRILNEIPTTTEGTKTRLESLLDKISKSQSYHEDALIKFVSVFKKNLTKQFTGKNGRVIELVEQIPSDGLNFNLEKLNEVLSRVANNLTTKSANLFKTKNDFPVVNNPGKKVLNFERNAPKL